ncbi:MAG: type II toxin-antitoxin system HicB family antitoxin [Candidatus Latescibacteria bacterium]|nr:type II toxin-antitoxin system HicB family antitoxin [Candidatus Latescibacterota bacterium]
MDMEITFTVTLPIVFTKREKWYLATCPILDVNSQGKTQREASKNLKEALELFLVSCFERGTLDKVLKECGFMPHYPTENRKMSHFKNTIDVPIPFYIQSSRTARCHA